MNTIKSFIAIVICVMFSGCSFLSELFIQNRSRESIFVTITYNVSATEFMEKANRMDYVSQICNAEQYHKDDRKAPLKITHRSDSTVSFFIPPQSTARIESAGNHEFMNDIRQISYDGNHFSAKRFIAASEKRRFNYIHRID